MIVRRIKSTLLNTLVSLFSLSCIFPVIWMIYSSLKTEQEFSLNIISLPAKPQFSNFVSAFEIGRMQDYFLNSVVTSVSTVVLVLILSFFSSYFLARYTFKGSKFLYYMFLFGLLVPIHGLLIPIFVQFSNFNLLDKSFTLLLPYTAFGLPLSIFLFESFIKTLPLEVEEAAIIDGCDTFTRLMRIVFPLTKPVMSTITVLTFLNAWNEFPFALTLLTSNKYKTVPIGLTNFSGQYTTSNTQLMAGLVIAVTPVIIVYIILNRQIVKGMTAGAVKG